MQIVTFILSILTAASIPSIIAKRSIEKLDKRAEEREKRAEERERARNEQAILSFAGTDAALALGIAHATEDIRYKQPNGETTAALEYAIKVKHQMKDFYVKQGTAHLAEG